MSHYCDFPPFTVVYAIKTHTTSKRVAVNLMTLKAHKLLIIEALKKQRIDWVPCGDPGKGLCIGTDLTSVGAEAWCDCGRLTESRL